MFSHKKEEHPDATKTENNPNTTNEILKTDATVPVEHHPEIPTTTEQIVTDTNLAPSLQGPARELESSLTKNQLEDLLRHQKDRQSLVNQGILEDTCVADSLLSSKKELERHMAGDKVEQGLRERHSKEELTHCGVLKEGVDSLQSVRSSLEQEQKKIKLNHKLADRPSPEELQHQHILETQESLAEKEQRRQTAAQILEEQIAKQHMAKEQPQQPQQSAPQVVKKKNHKRHKKQKKQQD